MVLLEIGFVIYIMEPRGRLLDQQPDLAEMHRCGVGTLWGRDCCCNTHLLEIPQAIASSKCRTGKMQNASPLCNCPLLYEIVHSCRRGLIDSIQFHSGSESGERPSPLHCSQHQMAHIQASRMRKGHSGKRRRTSDLMMSHTLWRNGQGWRKACSQDEHHQKNAPRWCAWPPGAGLPPGRCCLLLSAHAYQAADPGR